jgi:hypothetical protein
MCNRDRGRSPVPFPHHRTCGSASGGSVRCDGADSCFMLSRFSFRLLRQCLPPDRFPSALSLLPTANLTSRCRLPATTTASADCCSLSRTNLPGLRYGLFPLTLAAFTQVGFDRFGALLSLAGLPRLSCLLRSSCLSSPGFAPGFLRTLAHAVAFHSWFVESTPARVFTP